MATRKKKESELDKAKRYLHIAERHYQTDKYNPKAFESVKLWKDTVDKLSKLK